MKKRGRRRKNGRPSLVDLQKRAAHRLQQDGDANPSPTATAGDGPLRRSTRRSSFRLVRDDDDEECYEGGGLGGGRRRKEKQLELVLGSLQGGEEDPPGVSWGLPNGWGKAGSRSDGERHMRIGGCGFGGNGSEKGEPEFPSLFLDAGNKSQGEPSDSGPRTPLPDKKLLLLTLGRLQKKDKYKVYSEPVDLNELPDYHEIIENAMDFSTIRKKLSDDAYTCLEDFEKDVFLISSNAMAYNAPSTIYFRQARSIEELAKKCFENLRQGGDDDDLEHKLVRRGRPPGKNSGKKPIENGRTLDKPFATSLCYQSLHSSQNMNRLDSQTAVRIEHLSVHGNKVVASEENERNFYDWSTPYFSHGSHILNAVEGDRRLIPSRLAFILNMHMHVVLLGLLLILARLVGKLLPSGSKRLCHLGQG